MLTAKRQVPLPHAVSDYLEDDGEEVPVISSHVTLELEFAHGQALTVQRTIKGEADRRLIRTWTGRALTTLSMDQPSVDFFVRDPGAAQREAGFHHHLAQLLGWSLPEVPRYDGATCPLYMEAIFPLLFVEQKRGWLGLQARMPTHLAIRDPQARAIEFLLALDADQARTRQTKLEGELQHLSDQWRAAHAVLQGIVQGVHGESIGVPAFVSDPWPVERAAINLPEGEGWVELGAAILLKRRRLDELNQNGSPAATVDLQQTSSELKARQMAVANLTALTTKLEEQSELAHLEQRAAASRLTALDRDLQRNRDAQKLRNLGSIGRLSVARDLCPTCHQTVTEHMLDLPRPEPMSLEENIEFIEEMRSTVEATSRAAARRAESSARRLAAEGERLSAARGEVRRLRRSLTQDERLPSIAKIEEGVRIEHELERFHAASRRFHEVVATLFSLHERFSRVRAILSNVQDAPRSNEDEGKLKTFQDSFVNQLADYGLRSLAESRISLDAKTYRPKADGMPDLEFELSGSDLVRAIWAFYVALLETGRRHETNHPGLLIVDEPKQQGAATMAIVDMLRRASRAEAFDQQVIVASSSESTDALRMMMASVPYSEISLDGWALQPTV